MDAIKDIESVLRLESEVRAAYKEASDAIDTENLRALDLLHAIEFEKDHRKRSPYATRLHNSRIIRRQMKELVEILEPLKAYFDDSRNKPAFDRLKEVLGEVRKVSKRQENRSYRLRVPDETLVMPTKEEENDGEM